MKTHGKEKQNYSSHLSKLQLHCEDDFDEADANECLNNFWVGILTIHSMYY